MMRESQDRPKGLVGRTGRSPVSPVKYSKEERERETAADWRDYNDREEQKAEATKEFLAEIEPLIRNFVWRERYGDVISLTFRATKYCVTPIVYGGAVEIKSNLPGVAYQLFNEDAVVLEEMRVALNKWANFYPDDGIYEFVKLKDRGRTAIVRRFMTTVVNFNSILA